LYKIPANTLFLGKNIVFVPECHSTNTLAQQITQNQTSAEGAIVITENQTAGRGQHGNIWLTEPGKNLTFSIILKPSFLALGEQFYLSIITTLGIFDFLKQHIQKSVAIKWPNDLLVCDKKICGILIENQVQGSKINNTIVGIGLNVNQRNFQSDRATSLTLETNIEFVLEEQLHKLLEQIERRYLQLRNKKFSELKDNYLSHLYWRNEKHLFTVSGKNLEGTIQGVDESGRLIVFCEGRDQAFGIKEISFIK
jgi:BirA family biotin operon repressor/biotin-[acetyl-CoA-carboxylase] ligase